jgi:hypothetical protein
VEHSTVDIDELNPLFQTYERPLTLKQVIMKFLRECGPHPFEIIISHCRANWNPEETLIEYSMDWYDAVGGSLVGLATYGYVQATNVLWMEVTKIGAHTDEHHDFEQPQN